MYGIAVCPQKMAFIQAITQTTTVVVVIVVASQSQREINV